jgi:hypothetical protein
MTLQLLHSEFRYIWGKFYFLFYQCTVSYVPPSLPLPLPSSVLPLPASVPLVPPHCKEPIQKIRNIYSQKRKCAALSPNFHIHVSVSDFYIPLSICLFCRRKYVDRSWVYINLSQTHECGNWDWAAQFPEKEYINGIFVAVRPSLPSSIPFSFMFPLFPYLSSVLLALPYILLKSGNLEYCVSPNLSIFWYIFNRQIVLVRFPVTVYATCLFYTKV